MLRKFTVLATALILFVSLPITALASSAGTIKGYPNFRSAPSTSSTVYSNLRDGQSVTVLEQTNRYWYKIRVGSRTGYVSYKYINVNGSSSSSSSSSTGTITGYPNFRSAPSTNSTVYENLRNGQRVTVLEKTNAYWYKIRANGRTGYVSYKFINVGSGSSGSSSGSSSSVSSKANAVLSTAQRFLGTPYKFGATYEKDRRFDCSSFVQYVFRQHGISLPRTTTSQAKQGTAVSRSNLRKGDLIFFTVNDGNRIGHVGIYAGNNRVIHTYGSGGVKYSNINSSYWKRNYVTARRVIR